MGARQKRRQTSKKSSKQQKKSPFGGLRPMEMVAIGLLSIATLLYAFNKCGRNNNTATNSTNTVVNDSTSLETNNLTSVSNLRPIIQTRFLYVVVDSLKLRRGAALDSPLIRPLRYGDKVTELQIANSTDRLKLAYDIEQEAPWVKIRTLQGEEGWVFGGGLHFFRAKTPSMFSKPLPDSILNLSVVDSVITENAVDTTANGENTNS